MTFIKYMGITLWNLTAIEMYIFPSVIQVDIETDLYLWSTTQCSHLTAIILATSSVRCICYALYIYATSQRKRRRIESDKRPKELDSFSLPREDVAVGLPAHPIFLIIIRGNSSRNDSRDTIYNL